MIQVPFKSLKTLFWSSSALRILTHNHMVGCLYYPHLCCENVESVFLLFFSDSKLIFILRQCRIFVFIVFVVVIVSRIKSSSLLISISTPCFDENPFQIPTDCEIQSTDVGPVWSRLKHLCVKKCCRFQSHWILNGQDLGETRLLILEAGHDVWKASLIPTPTCFNLRLEKILPIQPCPATFEFPKTHKNKNKT